MRHPLRRSVAAVLTTTALALGSATTLLTAPPATAGAPADRPVVVVPGASAQHWDPLTDDLWSFEGEELVLTRPGSAPPGPRRPFEYAVVDKGPELGSVDYHAEVRIDEPVAVDNRDVILVFNYQSPTRFSYAHLSQDNTIYPHNGIFVVDDADRVRIDDQWDGSLGAAPAIDDADWHDVRLTFDAATGAIAVYVDDTADGAAPLMTATDTTFDGGRVGFGSFDNYGRVRHVQVHGTAR